MGNLFAVAILLGGLGITSTFAFADGILNDARTTRRAGGVGNYLFHTDRDDATLDEIRKVGADGVEVISFSQGAPERSTSRNEESVRRILFAWGSYRVSAAAEKTLDEVAHTLKASPEMRAEIAGFADEEDEKFIRRNQNLSNEEISSARAKAVRDALEKKGVSASQVFWTGKGAVSASESSAMMMGMERTKNRRVEIRFPE